MRIATYNIHGCIGTDRRREPRRVLRVLEELDADVIALQEVEAEEAGEPLGLFAKALACSAVTGPTLLRGGRFYGNALLTRVPLAGVTRLDISMPGREPRGAIDAILGHESGPVRVMATHLGLAPGERRRQVRKLLAHLGPDLRDPAVFLGDLNEWWLWGRPLRSLRRSFARTPAPPTYPSWLPLLALDRIWVHPQARLRSIAVHRSARARTASDHLPLVATIGSGVRA
jgi:endonuclease/exonuclease/phosphatase family metal-dependent hydrolase